jgi:hypothetical protein
MNKSKARALVTHKSGDGELVDCAFCKGSGWIHPSTLIFGEKCPVCGGVGKKRAYCVSIMVGAAVLLLAVVAVVVFSGEI